MMMDPATELQLRPASGRRVHEGVVDAIRAEILAGRLKVGDRLPGERQLGEMLGVSRTSVREALRVLESQSIIRARVGAGPESGSVVIAEEGDLLSRLLIMQTALDTLSLAEVVDVRCLLEQHAVRSAATLTAVDPDALAPVGEALERMRFAIDCHADFIVADADFHLAIAELSGNRLLAYFMRSLRELLEQILDVVYDDVDEWEQVARAVCAEHAAILQAMQVGDGDLGADLVTKHIRRAYDRRLADGDIADPDSLQALVGKALAGKALAGKPLAE